MGARLILGVNPIVGVDHASADRARKALRSMDDRRPLDVIRAAIGAGASGFTFSPEEQVITILKTLRDAGEASEITLYPVLPALGKYWPAYLSRGAFGLMSAVLEDLSWGAKARVLLKGGATALTSDPLSAIGLYVDIELQKIQAAAPKRWRIGGAFLGEAFTDMIVSLQSYELIRAFDQAARSAPGVTPGLQTRNLARLLSTRRGWDTGRPLAIMAPFNPIGFQMTPDREACEAQAESSKGLEFVAISVLAAGQVSLKSAASYLAPRQNYIRSVVVGTSSPTHAIETFSYLGQSLNL